MSRDGEVYSEGSEVRGHEWGGWNKEKSGQLLGKKERRSYRQIDGISEGWQKKKRLVAGSLPMSISLWFLMISPSSKWPDITASCKHKKTQNETWSIQLLQLLHSLVLLCCLLFTLPALCCKTRNKISLGKHERNSRTYFWIVIIIYLKRGLTMFVLCFPICSPVQKNTNAAFLIIYRGQVIG